MHKLFTLFTLFILPFFISADERPNIILILVDDMGYSDLGCFGLLTQDRGGGTRWGAGRPGSEPCWCSLCEVYLCLPRFGGVQRGLVLWQRSGLLAVHLTGKRICMFLFRDQIGICRFCRVCDDVILPSVPTVPEVELGLLLWRTPMPHMTSLLRLWNQIRVHCSHVCPRRACGYLCRNITIHVRF